MALREELCSHRGARTVTLLCVQLRHHGAIQGLHFFLGARQWRFLNLLGWALLALLARKFQLLQGLHYVQHGSRSQRLLVKRLELTESDSHQLAMKKNGVGDAVWYLGWTKNYQETIKLDYIDFTAKLGALIPSADPANPSLLDIPLGYNKHPGIAFTLDSSIGAYDWLTVGGHLGALALFDRETTACMQTDLQPNDVTAFIKGKACEHSGPIVQAAAYAKADHLVRGFSLLTGYSFTQKAHDCLTPCDTKLFTQRIVNQDPRLQGWEMHVIHLFAEYDFTQEDMQFGPRVGLFYNHPFAGKRIFITNMTGGTIGLDIDWQF